MYLDLFIGKLHTKIVLRWRQRRRSRQDGDTRQKSGRPFAGNPFPPHFEIVSSPASSYLS